jgi:hypothetical protein
MVDKGRVAAALRERPFGRIIGIVYVKMGDCPNRYVGKTCLGKTESLAGKELKVAVSTDMDNDVSPIDLLDPEVSGKILVWRGAFGIMKDLADLAVTPRPITTPLGLDMDCRIAKREPGDQDLPVMDHAQPGRIAPEFMDTALHFLRERTEVRHERIHIHLH